MREFIVLGHTAAISTDFTLDDLPGSAGRLDVLCRCVTSSFFTSHDLRTSVRLLLVLRDRYVVRFEGSELEHVNPDERSTGALFKKVLERRHLAERKGEIESTPGIYISAGTLEDVLERASSRGTILLLEESGSELTSLTPPDHPVFVLSDHEPFRTEEENLIRKESEKCLCVSPLALHSHQSITIAHHYLDTNGYGNLTGND